MKWRARIVAALAMLWLFLFCGAAKGWDWKTFPNLEGKEVLTTQWGDKGDMPTLPDEKTIVVMDFYDTDGDGTKDTGIGWATTEWRIVFSHPLFGTKAEWNEETLRTGKPTYYWRDLDGNGCPCGGPEGGLMLSEFLYDPAADGLNGNEREFLE